MTEKGEGVDKGGSAASAEAQAVETGNEGAAAHVEPNWVELLRIERERADKLESERDNYKQGLLTHKRQEKAARDEGDDGDDKIAQAVKKALEPVVSQLQGNKMDQVLSSLVSDPSKREYVKTLYQTRIQRTGTSDEAIRSDLETALALADSTRFSKENAELKRMNDNRTYVPPNGGGTADRGNVVQKAHKWSLEQEESLAMRARANGITDIEKYKELAWKAAQDGSAFAVKKKYL